jgi:predicted metal-dependent HD superfamily phosphohydrolase
VEDITGWVRSLPFEWVQGCPEQVFYEAREAYRSPGRHYHTWGHVEDCVEKLRAMPLEEPRTAFLALVFHDAVYVPGRKDNEALSADLADDVLREHTAIPEGEREAIRTIILATRNHVAERGASQDLRTALDVDMSILGADRESYDAYVAGVKREYVPAAASEAQFKAGRAAFLTKLLTTRAMFTTDEGKMRWQAAARANVALELAELTQHETFRQRCMRWLAARRG